jgi:type I restriction-modification system DNA methylase subunit|uniref:site-specific DNA-methyltransferase (adenine-specific) n=1 Tax=viral metagenome TaxID=1070528 RepID=A0A6C0IMM3_9ZZZZ
MERMFSELSLELTKSVDKQQKKNNGIYFTPIGTVYKTLQCLKPYMENIKNILEPSCGSGEYINGLTSLYSDLELDCIEFYKPIYDSIKSFEETVKDSKISIYNENYLLSTTIEGKKYDLIIGNPPFFVMKKTDVDRKYWDFFDGRPNIFILFILCSLEKLEEGGIISFILPNNFLNCLYYDKTRKHIAENCSLIMIDECSDDFIETKQETIIFIIQNKVPNKNENSKYILQQNGYTIFGMDSNISCLNNLYNNSSTLAKMNFSVNVGNVVWNQCKDILTHDKSETLLIYSSDIKNNKLQIKKYNNEEKKNYIKKPGNSSPLLVINRGYGKGEYKFEYCLIEGGFEYLIENHLICIRYNGEVNNDELINIYKNIIQSLENEKTKQFINLYFGNNAINTSELCNILPIYKK